MTYQEHYQMARERQRREALERTELAARLASYPRQPWTLEDMAWALLLFLITLQSCGLNY
jgi:hypothetical protein